MKQLLGLQCFGSVFGQETSFVGQYHDFTLSFNVNSLLPLCGFEVPGFTSPNSVYVGEWLHDVCPIHQKAACHYRFSHQSAFYQMK